MDPIALKTFADEADMPSSTASSMVTLKESATDPEIAAKEERNHSGRAVTDWRAIGMGTFIAFLCSVENNIIGMGEWPYMSTIDREATSTFFGLVTSVCRIGHAGFALIFAAWAHRSRQSKYPLLVGRLIALLGCVLYLLVEFVPTHRRYAMLLCYFLFGTGFSTSPLLRSYIAKMSSSKNRASAYALFNVAVMISIIIGPIGQLLFTGISYPGYEIFPNVRFHIYSAPIWLALITNIIAIGVVFFCFDDPREVDVEVEGEKTKSLSSSSSLPLAERLRAALEQPFTWSLVCLCLLQKMISLLTLSVIHSVIGPMMMSTFGFDGTMTVRAMAVSQGICGLLALSLSGVIVFGKIEKKINSRYFYLFSLCVIIFMYFSTYPWPGTSVEIPPYNATSNSGCDPTKYSWCETTRGGSPWIFMPVLVIVMGLAFPSGAISLDTIYSRILGNIDQSLMQSALIIAEDVMLIVGPIYAASMFTAYGMGPLWLLNGVVMIAGAGVWIAFWRQLEPYSSHR